MRKVEEKVCQILTSSYTSISPPVVVRSLPFSEWRAEMARQLAKGSTLWSLPISLQVLCMCVCMCVCVYVCMCMCVCVMWCVCVYVSGAARKNIGGSKMTLH